MTLINKMLSAVQFSVFFFSIACIGVLTAFGETHAQASLGPSAGPAVDPAIEWKQLETEHFSIVFDSRRQQLAQVFAAHAERAWLSLVPVLRTWPDKTVVVIDDSVDQANGLATGFPYPQIRLFPAAPNPGETIADTGPWYLELITHEYTHVLNFQPAHGAMHWLRNIFGSIVRPNTLLPRWYSEGLAVELETRFSPSGGRLRSPDFTAIPRAMIQDDVLRKEDISRINEVSIPDWPGGARPYLFGGLIWHSLAKRDLKIIGDLNDHFGRRVPFAIQTPIVERTDQTWQQVLDNVFREIETRAVHQIERICESDCDDGVSAGETGFFSRSPLIEPSGDRIAWIGREHNHDSVVFVAERDASPALFNFAGGARLAEPTAANRVSWLPRGMNGVVFDGIDSVGRYEDRSELWLYDISAKKKYRLSDGLRGREPDVDRFSPQTAPLRIAFTQLVAGGTQIAIGTIGSAGVAGPTGAVGTVGSAAVDEKEKWRLNQIEVVYQPPADHRVAWPTFTGSGELIFVERSPDGQESIRAVDLQTRRSRQIDLGGNATFPRWIDSSPQGLLFASNRSGVTNLYFARATREGLSGGFAAPVPLTNTATRSWNGDLDPKSKTAARFLIHTRLDGTGSRLHTLKAVEQRTPLVRIEPLVERTDARFTPPLGSNLSAPLPAAEDFSPWGYLLPRYWMPFASYVPGGVFVSASTSAADPVGRHALAASVSSDSRIGKPNLFLAYANSTTPVKVTVLGDDTWQRLTTGLNRRMTTADASGVFFLPGLSNSWLGEGGFNYQRSDLQSANSTDERQRGGPRLGVLWSDISQKGREISPEKGGLAKLTHAWYRPEFGNQTYDKTDLSLSGYISRFSHRWLSFIPERHALVLSAAVSWAPGLDRLFLGPSSISLNAENVALGATGTSFIMRGYPSGAFIGRRLIRTTAEYRFPLTESYHGFGTFPAFIQRWHGAVFADAIGVDGAMYDYDIEGYRATALETVFVSVGAEARVDTTVFHHVPLQVIFGVHFGFDRRANPNGAYPIISIGL